MIGFLSPVEGTPTTIGNFAKVRTFSFDKAWMPSLRAGDQFGQSITSYYDVDGNGISDFVIGAPGDDADLLNNLTDTGAIYLIFLEREKYEWPIVDLTLFYILITVLPGCYCICCIMAIGAFLYTFRHQEDEVEKLAKEAGLSSVKLGESAKLRRTTYKIFPLKGNTNPEEELDLEIGRPSSAKSDKSSDTRPNNPHSGGATMSKKSSKRDSKSNKALIYHRQKSSIQTYSKKIDDFEDDERVEEYF